MSHTSELERATRFALILLFLVGISMRGSGHANAQTPPCEQPHLRSQIVEHLFDDKSSELELPLYIGMTTTLYPQWKLTGASIKDKQSLWINVRPDSVTLSPSTTTGGSLVIKTDAMPLRYKLRVVDKPEQAVSVAFVSKRLDAGPSVVRPALSYPCPKKSADVEPVTIIRNEYAAEIEILRDKEFIGLASLGYQEIPVTTRELTAGQVTSRGVKLSRSGSRGVLFVRWTNHGNTDAVIGNIAVQNRADRLFDYAKAIFVNDEPLTGDGTTVMPAGQAVLAQIILDNLDSAAMPLALTMSVQEEAGGPVRERETWFVPIEEPPDENEEKNKAAAGRISLDVQALYGAIWLSAGTGLDELAAASLSGLGVRVGYGFNRFLSFEGAVVGATSGAACFMTPGGELERSVMLGRIYMGGLLRFGERFMPTARLGVGLQGASQRSEMLDGSMDDSAFEFGFLLGAGIGLDVRLNDSLLLGVGISGEQNQTTDTISFESGIHLGYAWKP